MTAFQEAIDSYGVQHFKVSDIARAAGVTRQTVTHHFGSKDHLIRAFALEQGQAFQQVLLDRLAAHDDVVEGITAAVSDVLVFVTSRPSFQPPLRQDWIEYINGTVWELDNEMSQLFGEAYQRALGVDLARALDAGALSWRLTFSSLTHPPGPELPLERQARIVALGAAAALSG